MTRTRWHDYVLRSGDGMVTLWKQLVQEERRILYVLGLGFDERMCAGVEALAAIGGTGSRDVALLVFEEGPESASHAQADLRASNDKLIREMTARTGWGLIERQVKIVSDEGRRVGGRTIAKQFSNAEEFAPYTDVVVDISALPRSLYFPLIAKLLTLFDHAAAQGHRAKNLHVVVAHSPVLDTATHDEGIDESATYLHGFSAAEFELEATREQPRVWIPVLGRGQRAQLDRIITGSSK